MAIKDIILAIILCKMENLMGHTSLGRYEE